MVESTSFYSKSSMYTEKILGITNTHKETSRNRQYKVKEWQESTMCGEKMLGNHQCVRKKYSGSSMYAKKMLGIVNVYGKYTQARQGVRENARNCQCKVGKCSESSMQSGKML